MTHVCAWCQLPTPVPVPLDGPSSAPHGLCPTCLQAFERQRGTEVLAWIEEVSYPAVAVDQDVRIRAANQAACDLLHADWVALLGQPLCGVLGCEASHGSRGGSRCALHGLVDRTFMLGACGATALANARADGGLESPFCGHLITSLRAGGVVALRIDPLADTA